MATAVQITVSERQRAILEEWERNKADTPYRVVIRSQIILMSAQGIKNVEQGHRLGVTRRCVERWRIRWANSESRLAEAERSGVSNKDLRKLLGSIIEDDERSGAPATFTAEQLAALIALACEKPEASGIPVTHWTPADLAREAIKRGIVKTISPRHVDRVLKGGISARTRAATG